MSDGGFDRRYLTPPEVAIIGMVCPPDTPFGTGSDLHRLGESRLEGAGPGEGCGRLDAASENRQPLDHRVLRHKS